MKSEADLDAWLSWLKRCPHMAEIEGSNPSASTKYWMTAGISVEGFEESLRRANSEEKRIHTLKQKLAAAGEWPTRTPWRTK